MRRVVLLLVSADFVASKYCYEIEMERALARHKAGEATVIPVILRPCAWHKAPFGKLNALPKDGKPVTEWKPRDKAWLDVVQGLRKVITAAGPASPPRKAPKPHNLPFGTLGDLFKGRGEVLAELGEGKAVAITAVQHTIHGLGGVGKTRLAVEYAWRHLEGYSAALFVIAESPEKIQAGLAALAGPAVLGLLDRDQMNGPQEPIVDVVLDWLRTQPGWLLIFDNVDVEAAAVEVEKLLPRLTAGHVLINSRLASWGAPIHCTALDTIPLDEARAFLLERTGEADAEHAGELAELLGGLPLALEQAAAYMIRRKRSLARYLKEWRAQRKKVLAWHDERLMKYPTSVAATWVTTFELLSAAARTVLRIGAHLAPEPISIEMFEEGAEIVGEAHAALCQEQDASPDLDDALAELADYSMITRREETFTIHRLVQEVTRSRIDEDQRKAWAVWALRVVRGYAPAEAYDVRTWAVWDPLRPHAGRVLEHGEKVGNPEPAVGLMNQLALLLKTKALHSEAEPLMRRALEIDEASYGPQHPEVARDLNNLAQLLQATNRLSEAEPLMRRALEIDEASYGPQHPNVASHLNNLAQLLQATNRLSEAEPLMRRAFEIWTASLGPEHPSTQGAQRNLGAILSEILTQERDASP